MNLRDSHEAKYHKHSTKENEHKAHFHRHLVTSMKHNLKRCYYTKASKVSGWVEEVVAGFWKQNYKFKTNILENSWNWRLYKPGFDCWNSMNCSVISDPILYEYACQPSICTSRTIARPSYVSLHWSGCEQYDIRY